MSAKKFTVLVIPEGSHRVRRFKLKRSQLYTVAALVALLLLGVSLLGFDYYRISFDRHELGRLRTQNLEQQKELRLLAARLNDLRQEMVVLAQNDAKVRVMAQLSGPKPDTLAGVGGPQQDLEVADEFAALQHQIDQLGQAIDLRRQSQEEIQGFLNDQRSLLAAKPEGKPANGWLASNFGMRKDPFNGRRKMHEGVDIAARTGSPVFATADGVVSRAGARTGYGKLVVIDHGYGYQTYYGHNSKIHVKVGQRVRRGDKIAAVGNTGRSTGPHVHYEVRRNGVPLNPKKFL